MAGRGSRFADRGYQTPKPLIEVAGKPMVLWAIKSLEKFDYSEIIFVVLREHQERYDVVTLITQAIGDKAKFVFLEDVTQGQLCTVLAAEEYINSSEDVLIAASDTYIKSEMASHIANKASDCKGLISVANLAGSQWSFAKTDEKGKVVEVAEKVRISDHASTGLYYFSDGSQLVSLGKTMIANQETTRGEYYVIPVYQKIIAQGEWVGISQADEMWDMGTPEAKIEFEHYLQTNIG